jgi:predicted N-formylglutamate amidohydrolase
MNYHELSTNYDSPFIITCEHASSHIPPQYNNLGLSDDDLHLAKDAYDPGSLALARRVAQELSASLISMNISRLVIDANRPKNATTNTADTFHAATLKTELLVGGTSDHIIPIPGNQVPDTKAEELLRWNTYVAPYYDEVYRLTQQLLTRHSRVYIAQIHSFYPIYNNDVRTVDIDVAHEHTDMSTRVLATTQALARDRYTVGDNQPWGMDSVDSGIFRDLKTLSNVSVIAFDINNKHLLEATGVASIGDIVSSALSDQRI